MKKRVLIVGPAHPLRGGLATFDERLCRAFIQMGYECEILSFSLQYPGFLFPGTTQYSDAPPPVDIIIHSDLNSINPVNWIWNGIKYRKKSFDMVIFRYWIPFMGPCLGTFARCLNKKKTYITAICDNLIPHEKRPGDSLFTRYFSKSMHGMLSMSRAVYNDIGKWFPGINRTYHPHPMYDMFGSPINQQEARKKLKLNPSGNYILFFGFIRKYKGLDILIQAMNHPEIKNKDIKLIVAGEFYEDAKPYLNLIDELGLKEQIILKTEFIPDIEVGNYFCAADFVVQPYRSATQSGVTQIAYFYGVPMIVTSVGGLVELVPHNITGFIVSPENPKEISTYILRFYSENLYDIMHKNVLEENKKFTWNSLVNALIQLK